jgi:RNA polymerase sigma-70 factor (ECF subfamily)
MIHKTGFLEKMLAPAREVDWEAVYQAELPRVYNFFRYRLGDDGLAEDLTADTFEKAWRNRARYRNDLAAFSTWLFTIAKHVATDYFRKHRTEVSIDEAGNLSGEEAVENAILESDDFQRLRLLLGDLPARERELVALKYGAELTNRAIARVSGLRESNVGTILHRVMQQLRLAWEEEK